MAKKRKSDNAGLDEVERTLYTSFCTAANSISQLYTQAQQQQKVAFQAGERHCVERIYQWLHREYQAGSNISTAEILNYLQNELDGEEMTMSSGMQFQQQPLSHQHQQQQSQHHQQQLLSPNNQVLPGAVGYQPGRVGAAVDQTKLSIFTGALSSPNRRSLQPLAVVHGGYGSVNHVSLVGNVGRRSSGGADQHHEAVREEQESPTSNQTQPYLPSQTHSVSLGGYGYIPPVGQHRESHTFGENDSSMDMHADGGSDDYYHHSN